MLFSGWPCWCTKMPAFLLHNMLSLEALLNTAMISSHQNNCWDAGRCDWKSSLIRNFWQNKRCECCITVLHDGSCIWSSLWCNAGGVGSTCWGCTAHHHVLVESLQPWLRHLGGQPPFEVVCWWRGETANINCSLMSPEGLPLLSNWIKPHPHLVASRITEACIQDALVHFDKNMQMYLVIASQLGTTHNADDNIVI